MPTFNDPTADAEEARQALRGLAHATMRIDDPDILRIRWTEDGETQEREFHVG